MRRTIHPMLAVVLVVFVASGCADGNSGGGRGGRSDGGVDAGSPDANGPDSTAPDAGATDSGTPDAPPAPRCGDGVKNGSEACDQTDLGGATCSVLGFIGGTLRCDADCNYDTSGCSSCGDGTKDEGEECDGMDLGGESCTSQGFSGGALACRADCTLDPSGCIRESCGNGSIEGMEACDDGNSDNGDGCSAACTVEPGWSCPSAGMPCVQLCGNGMVDTGEECDDGNDRGGDGCSDTCQVEPGWECPMAGMACTSLCGNGSIDPGEECDGSDFGMVTCEGRGFGGGTLRCTSSCTIDTSGCSSCGDGAVDPGEECDGSNLAGHSCTTRGFSGGSLSCAPDCTFDTSMCTGCGDGVRQAGEQCDGMDLGGESCTTRGFSGGSLSCAPDCTFDTSACTTSGCGNGVVDPGEECDDGNTDVFDGCDASCQVEPTFYLPVRLVDVTLDASNRVRGRVEVRFQGMWRDICNDNLIVGSAILPGGAPFANVVCRQLGYTGHGHTVYTDGRGSPTPLMDEVACMGDEASLAQCDFDGWGVEDCSADEAVGVLCVPGEGDIVLVDGPSSLEGRLRIFHDGSWGDVCDDYIDGRYYSGVRPYGADTVCQQLGYKGGIFKDGYDAPTGDFLLDDVNCMGTERRIAECPNRGWSVENCVSSEGAGFQCDLYDEGDIRLVEGSARNEGRVEILHNGVWGTICDDYVTPSSTGGRRFAEVACRQLGFQGGGGATDTSVSGGEDPIWLDNVMCAGTESAIADCPANDWNDENCFHFEDVGLTCTP